jgi:hypothetical protein
VIQGVFPTKGPGHIANYGDEERQYNVLVIGFLKITFDFKQLLRGKFVIGVNG